MTHDSRLTKKSFRKIAAIMRHRVLRTSLTVGIALLIVLGVAAASVFIVYEYSTSTKPATSDFYLAAGPNYATALTLGLVSGGTTAGTEINSGTSLTINTVSGSGDTYLLNVFEVVNSSSNIKGAVYLYINGTLPSGVTIYWDNTTEMTFSGTDAGTYTIVNGKAPGNGSIAGTGSTFTSGPIPLTSNKATTPSPYTLYISFALTGAASGTYTLYFQYSVT